MPLQINDIRRFAGTDRMLFDPRSQGGTLQSVNKWQRFKSFFNIGMARRRNAETLAAIHNAILNDPQFFAKNVQDKAVELLLQVRTDRAIRVADIQSIVTQLDAMSTPPRRRAAAQNLLEARIAARGYPAFLPQSAQNDYVRLAKGMALPQNEPQGGFGRFDYAAALDAFDARLDALFTRLGDGAGDKEVLAGFLYKACKGKDQAEFDALADALRANLDESRAVGAQYGEATRLNVVEALAAMEKPIPPTAAAPHPIRDIVEAGRAIRSPALEALTATSSVEDIDRALQEFGNAITHSPVLGAVAGVDERASVQILLTQSAVNAMPRAAQEHLLATLESNAGRNLVALYAEDGSDRDAQALYGTAKFAGKQLKAALGRPNPRQSIPLPPHPDPTMFPPSLLLRYSFSMDRFVSGDAADLFMHAGDGLEKAHPGDRLSFRRRSSELAAAKTTLGICSQLKTSVVERAGGPVLDPEVCVSFAADLARNINVRFPDGSTIAKGSSLEEARLAFLRFATGDANATWERADHADKVKVLILMSFTNQNANGIAEESVFEAIAGGRIESYMLPVLHHDDRKIESHEFSKDANGDIRVRLRFRQGVADVAEGAFKPTFLAGESYREFELESRLPVANLDTLARADWAGLDFDTAKQVDIDRDNPDSIAAANLIPPACRFTGTSTVSAHLHLVKAPPPPSEGLEA